MSTSVLLIMSIAVFIVLSLSVYYYFEKTKEKRLDGVKKKTSMSEKNQAYNEVKKTKRLMGMMRRKGKDVNELDEVVDEAEKALERGKPSKAKNLADRAKNDLSNKKSSLNKSTSEDETPKKSYTIDELEQAEFKESKEGEKKREELQKQKEKLNNLPDNYLESKFEINVVEDLLEEEKPGERAEELYKEARSRFDREDYSGALRYSIKCKKAIKGNDAGLISGQDIDKREREGPPEEVKKRFPELVGQEEEPKGSSSAVPEDFQEEVEEVQNTAEKEDSGKKSENEISRPRSSQAKKVCPECGFEGDEKDSYCPKCGIELIMENKCPECGYETEEEDKFCRNCGAELLDSELVCPECGVEVEQDDKFCPNCGIEFG